MYYRRIAYVLRFVFDTHKEEQLLRRHVFKQWPGEEELARYLFDVNDKVDALAASLELNVRADILGRWNVVPAEPAPAPPQPYWKAV